jgi:predicted small metal-binding protein
MAYTYRCADFPGMEACPGAFTAATEAELWNHIELHAREAHQENPSQWSDDDRQGVKAAIRPA